MKIVTKNYEHTQEEGEIFAKKLRSGDIVLLFGNLGAGKTTFMQGLAKGLGIQRRIISPTFIIVRKYEVPHENVFLGTNNVRMPESSSKKDSGQARMTVKTLYHIDLYRVQANGDLKGLGLPEILEKKDAIIAIEWPEKLGSLSPKKRWELHFETIDEHTRSIVIEKKE